MVLGFNQALARVFDLFFSRCLFYPMAADWGHYILDTLGGGVEILVILQGILFKQLKCLFLRRQATNGNNRSLFIKYSRGYIKVGYTHKGHLCTGKCSSEKGLVCI